PQRPAASRSGGPVGNEASSRPASSPPAPEPPTLSSAASGGWAGEPQAMKDAKMDKSDRRRIPITHNDSIPARNHAYPPRKPQWSRFYLVPGGQATLQKPPWLRIVIVLAKCVCSALSLSCSRSPTIAL